MTDPGETHAAVTQETALPRRAGTLLFLFALALRLPMLPHHRLAEGDGAHYVTLARAVLAGDLSGLANPYWSNLWPAVIAAVAWLTHSDVVTAGRIASLVAGSGLAPATASLANRTLGRSTGVVAGLLVASHPWLIHFSTLLFTESFFAILLVMLLQSAVRRRGVGGAAVTGAWAGVAALTRPEVYAAIAAVVLDILRAGRFRLRGVAARRTLVFLSVVLALVLSRGLLIHRVSGTWDFGGTKATANLLVGLAATDSERERVATELGSDDEGALATTAREVSAPLLALEHPGLLARHVGANAVGLLASAFRVLPFVPLVGGWPPLWGGDWPPVLALWAVLLCTVAVAGLVSSLREGAALLLPAAGLLHAAGLAVLTVHDRLLVPLVPLFLVFLAHGLVRCARRLAPARAAATSAVRFSLMGAAALLGPLFLAALVRAPVLDYASDPIVQREAGEWLAARYPPDTVLMTAGPCVGFYFHDAAHSRLEVSLPWADYPRVIEVVRRRGVRLLAVPEWHLLAARHPAADTLLDPPSSRGDLRLVGTLDREGRRMLIYELRPPTSTP